jgi:putative ABC transport system ATP-binding protein
MVSRLSHGSATCLCRLVHIAVAAPAERRECSGTIRGRIGGYPYSQLPTESASVEPVSAAAPAVVTARDVTRRFGEGGTAVDALRGVSLDIEQGKLTAVMGPSGSGKSTLMHIMAGLDKPTSGTVSVAGQEITSMSDNELTHLRREHIGFVFQFYNLLPMLTAEENVKLPLSVAGEKVDDGWFRQLIDKVGLAGRLRHRPSELSGGQQQRVAVARSLVSKPTVVFADEPTGNLDSKSSAEILALLKDATEAYGQTIVMVTHDPRAAAIADRILYIADGKIVLDQHGATEAEILTTMNELDALAARE